MEHVLGLGAATRATSDVLLELGQEHPSTHGGLRLRVTLEGDGPDAVVSSCEPLVGLLHRGAEKLFEVRDYRQVMVLANRHDWLAAFPNELGVALAVEQLLGMEVPARATWLRTLLCELTRVVSHVSFLGLATSRERLLHVLEELTGARVHVVFARIGGVREDLPRGWEASLTSAVAAVRADLLALELPVGTAGVLCTADALSYGVSGPAGRASGVDVDLRRDAPYLAYDQLDVPVVTRAAGDVGARFAVLHSQALASLDLVETCLAQLPDGPVNVPLPKTVRAPEGAAYVWTENPSGLTGWYLVSRGATTPWRLALRTPSFNNVSALPALLPGTRLADVPAVLASLFFVVGDLDR